LLKYALLVAAQIGVGAAAIFARYALTGAGPLAVSAARLSIAAAILLIAAAVKPPRSAPIPRKSNVLLWFAGVALAIHFASWIASLQYTGVAISTLLVSTTPLWVAIYDNATRERLLGMRSLCAFAAGAAGLILVVGFNSTRAPVPHHEHLGDVLALIGALAIGAYFIAVRRVGSEIGTRAVVTRTYTVAAVVLIAAAAGARQAPPPIADAAAWSGILAMALISQLVGHTALNAALRWFSAGAVAFTTVLEPVTAGVLAFAIFGERLNPAAVVGAVVLLAAIALFLHDEARSQPL
jgi:drug/metabolite transporter (DMT)-like permease